MFEEGSSLKPLADPCQAFVLDFLMDSREKDNE